LAKEELSSKKVGFCMTNPKKVDKYCNYTYGITTFELLSRNTHCNANLKFKAGKKWQN
jgi:hypothetical protein